LELVDTMARTKKAGRNKAGQKYQRKPKKKEEKKSANAVKSKHPPLYPLDANRKLISETVDEEGFTVKVFELEKNGEVTHITIRIRGAIENVPAPEREPYKPPLPRELDADEHIFPPTAFRKLINESTDSEGFNLKVYEISKGPQKTTVTVRSKLPEGENGEAKDEVKSKLPEGENGEAKDEGKSKLPEGEKPGEAKDEEKKSKSKKRKRHEPQDPLYPLDAKRTLLSETVDEEGFTVKTFRAEKNGMVTEFKVRVKIPEKKPRVKPEKKVKTEKKEGPLYPLHADYKLVKEEKGEDGSNAQTFEIVTKKGHHSTFTVRKPAEQVKKESVDEGNSDKSSVAL